MTSSQNIVVPETESAYEVTLESAFALAQGHHQSGNLVLAERTYRDILRTVPDHFPTTQFLGVLLYQIGSYDEAKRYLEIAVTTHPDDAQCLNNYGGILTQLGEHEKALGLYERALAIVPDYVDALNNKAQSQWSLERYKEAEATCRRALEISPDNILALNNLGMVLARRRKYEESIDVWEKASALAPDVAAILNNWGNVLREMGRISASIEKCRKAVELAPKNPESLNNLANALRDAGQAEEAVEYYIKATNERPDYYEAHNNLSIAYADLRLFEKSLYAARYAIAFKNDFYDSYINLGRAQFEMGEFEQAYHMAQRAAGLAPDKIEPYLDMAIVLLKMDRLEEAESVMAEALRLQPDSARAYMQLSEARERMQNFDGAVEALDKALEISPDMPMLWLRKAIVSGVDNKPEKALEYIDKALALNPGWYMGLHHKAEIMVSLGRMEEAEKIIRAILAFTTRLPSVYVTLAHLKRFKSEDDEDFIAMKASESEIEGYGNESAALFYSTLSDVYEQLKQYDMAFEYLEKANKLKLKALPSDILKDIVYHDMAKEKYTREFIEKSRGYGCPSDVPVFIIGMPRSGTTLTEQILSAHPDVYGAGELIEMGLVYRMIGTDDWIDEGEGLSRLGEEYVRRIKLRDTSGKALRIVDKMPANYLYAGFIDGILPNAKIIHCRRDAMDTSLSCLKQNFARGQYWSYDLESMAAQYKAYEDLMQYWREVMPDRILEIDYEDTVNDLEGQARKLIDFIGLEWNDACLEPHKQKRAVLTASKSQVTQPVYKTSVEKWKRYEKQLQPLVRALRPEQALPEDAE